MKASYNWIKDYLSVDIDPVKFGEILTDIGLEVEGMEQVESIRGGLRNIVAGEVKTCVKHPNADRLSLTTVHIGGEEDLQIVCGAPNVAAGQRVWVAPVGTTLYTPEGEPWEIKKMKVRGTYSEGMICAEDELGLGDDHTGIMVLGDDIAVGTPARDYYQVETDYVFEIGLTPNRSDATCHLGIARDVHAYLVINEGYEKELELPDTGNFEVDHTSMTIPVAVENNEACPRYSGVTITDIRIGESPDWLKKRLEAIGVRSINNVVDATNFVLHEMGQPLHAFDADKITGKKIIVRTLPEGTVFKSLDEVERKLSDKDLMICDGESAPMCIGGVFGGIDSGVTEDTTSIFLESAHFDAGWIRRTSTRHLLRTDAAIVFEKGSDPNITVTALKRAAMLIREVAGAKIASEIIDIYPEVILPVVIDVKYSHVNRLIGSDIPRSEIDRILKALKMEIVQSNQDTFSVAVPTNKSDVTREADLIEEILRIHGYNNVPLPHKMTTTIAVTDRPTIDRFRKTVGDFLASNGFDEIMGLSLTQSSFYTDKLPLPEGLELVPVMNTSNTNMDVMRPDLLVTALETVAYNQNRQQIDVQLFEFGHTYALDPEKQFLEKERLAFTLTGQNHPENWIRESRMSDYYTVKKYVDLLMARLGMSRFKMERLEDDPWFSIGTAIQMGPKTVGRFGVIRSALSRAFDIRNDVLYADFDMELLYAQVKRQKLIVDDLSKYPSVTRDLALILDKKVQFSDLQRIALKEAKSILSRVDLFDVYENEEHVGKGKKSYAVRLTFEDKSQTLTDEKVDQQVRRILKKYGSELAAELR